MADASRVRRVEENIKVTVARTLERRVKDPRVGFVTITEVKATRDLHHATIFYTVLGDEDEARATRRALESAKGLIRSEVGKSLGLRLTPTIQFEQDRLPEEAASIEDALRAARARDAEIAASSAGKEYVAGEDPYRSEKYSEGDPDQEDAS